MIIKYHAVMSFSFLIALSSAQPLVLYPSLANVPILYQMKAETLLKKRLRHRFFPVNFTKFLRTPIL